MTERKILVTMMALVLTIAALAQQEDGGEYQPSGMADMMAEMIAAKVHQECIDTARLVAVYDYECQTQDAEGKSVTDRMKLCLLVGRHCTRSFPYRKFRKEREWAEGKKQSAADFLQMNKREYMASGSRRKVRLPDFLSFVNVIICCSIHRCMGLFVLTPCLRQVSITMSRASSG